MTEFDKLSKAQCEALVNHLKDAAIQWAKANNVGGLSALGRWNVYRALEEVPERAITVAGDGE